MGVRAATLVSAPATQAPQTLRATAAFRPYPETFARDGMRDGMSASGGVMGRCRIGVMSAVIALSACAPPRAQAPLAPCDVATGTATSYSRGIALARAERALRTQTVDVRGDLISTGVRRVRLLGVRRTCEPYRLFGVGSGLVTCKVQAQMCGRYL